MIKKLDIIEIELYCLNATITAEKDPILIENKLNSYSPSSFCVDKKNLNIAIQEFNS